MQLFYGSLSTSGVIHRHKPAGTKTNTVVLWKHWNPLLSPPKIAQNEVFKNSFTMEIYLGWGWAVFLMGFLPYYTEHFHHQRCSITVVRSWTAVNIKQVKDTLLSDQTHTQINKKNQAPHIVCNLVLICVLCCWCKVLKQDINTFMQNDMSQINQQLLNLTEINKSYPIFDPNFAALSADCSGIDTFATFPSCMKICFKAVCKTGLAWTDVLLQKCCWKQNAWLDYTGYMLKGI